MAQKKLLFSLIMLMFSHHSFANKLSGQDLNDFQQIYNQRRNSMDNDKNSVVEEFRQIHNNRLKVMNENKNSAIDELKQVHINKLNKLKAGTEHNATLLVFVSSSMSRGNIKALIEEAKRYNAYVIIRGFINGSFRETSEFMQEFFSEGEIGGGVLIDPTLFSEYEVNLVPTFVLAKDEQFDKLTGNVPIITALGKFAAQGELFTDATKFLQNSR